MTQVRSMEHTPESCPLVSTDMPTVTQKLKKTFKTFLYEKVVLVFLVLKFPVRSVPAMCFKLKLLFRGWSKGIKNS